MDEIPPEVSVTSWIPNLKSILTLFMGLFCVLCFKKLLEFGRKWKNVIVDWGYRSMNMPSLWIADALSSYTSRNLDRGPPIHLGLNADYAKIRFRRVPALRLPDAWPNFLLTWMYLNLSTMYSLLPAWVAAINEELMKTFTQAKETLGETAPRSRGYRLELQSVLPESVPPRLSAIETSASGSTKELHFQCTFTSPCVWLQTALTKPGLDQSTNERKPTTHVLYLEKNACRVHLICAALEGGYVLLSWKLISPLIVNKLSLLTPELAEETELDATDARWIKDIMYQAIQSAVTRLILSPFCVTPVQKVSADHTTQPPQHIVASNESPTYPRPNGSAHLPGCHCLLQSPTIATHSVRIRLVSAILLEPLDANWPSVLRQCAWRCQLRSNAAFGPDVQNPDQFNQTAILATTPAAYLQSRSWPMEFTHPGKPMYPGVLQPLDSSPTTYVVFWNFDAFISTKKLHSDLLDVVLYTDPEQETDTAPKISGHAVLPLVASNECCAHNQHVVLVDCHFGQADRSLSPSSRGSAGATAQPSVKFMLNLKVEMSSVDCSDSEEVGNLSRISTRANWLEMKPPNISPPPSHGSTPRQSLPQSARPVSFPTVSDPNGVCADPLTSEQITNFMSKPTSAFDHKDNIVTPLRNRSRSFENGAPDHSPAQRVLAKRSGCIRSESQRTKRTDATESPTAIHGPIVRQRNSASFLASGPEDVDWLGPPLSSKTAGIGLTLTPPKKHRRFFRFRSNTTSSRGTQSSREVISAEPITNGTSTFVEGFIEPSSTYSQNDSSGRRSHFGSRIQRLFRRSLEKRRKSYEHMQSSQSLGHRLANSGPDIHSTY